MKLYKTILVAIALIMLATACDEITGDFEETPNIDIDTTTVVQKFLLEDYTGYTCGNCPAAHEVAQQVLTAFPGRVIVLGVHAGSFAVPYEAHPYDFRTPEGTTYDEFFGNSKAGNPNGMINRMKFNDSYIVRHSKWASTINGLIDQEPILGLKLNTSYNESNRKIDVTVDMNYLKASSDNDYVCVMISEDGIIQYQKDYRLKENQDILDYHHSHVLRGGITSAWGERVSITAIEANQKFSRNFTYTIPAGKDWNVDNLSIVAFVYSKDEDYKIIQAESKKLK